MKKWKQVIYSVLVSTSSVAAFPVTCNSIFAKSKPVADDADYEYVSVTGTLIKRRIKKGSTVSTETPVEGITPEAFDQMRQKIQSTGKLPAGGK